MEVNIENTKLSFAPIINSELSSANSSARKQKINFKDELVFLFFNSMLELIVDTCESDELDEVESIPSGSTIIYSKPYTQIVEEDLQNTSLLSVEGSNISLVKRSETSLKRDVSDLTTSKQKKRQNKKQKSEKLQNSITKSPNADKKIKKHSNSYKRNSNDLTSTVVDISEHHKESTSSTNSWFVECTDDNVIIQFRNGNMYEGHLSRKHMNGQGVFTWEDGTKYIGEFQNGTITGKGSMRFPDLSYYTGDFYNGYRHGLGSMIVADNPQVYNGSWQCGQRNGKGWMFYGPGNWYDGEWKDGLMHGHGMRRYASGSMYYGEWKNGLRHGQGVSVLKNKDFYSGNWVKGQKNGYGEYTWKGFLNHTFSFPPENKYCGSWENNLMHGVGVMNFGMGGGAKYAGCYDKNRKHGPGVVICENGISYEANPLFINDKSVHTTGSESLNSDTIAASPNVLNNKHNDCKITTSPINNAEKSPNLKNLYTRKYSTFGLVSKQIEARIPSLELDVATLANINMCKLKFPQIKEYILTQHIPINAPDDSINISFYIEKVVDKFNKIKMNSGSKICSKDYSFDSSPNKIYSPVTHPTVKCFDSPLFRKTFTSTDIFSDKEELWNTNRSELLVNEEKWLRKSITNHLPKLRSIYQQYASIACLKNLPFKAHLIRLFLWQMYRDCKISTCRGVSLVETDEILAENCENGVEKKHNPFELIYFWQFLHSLIGLAYRLYADDCIQFVNEGILKTAFHKFLEHDVFPNVGKHTGSVLFDYSDLLPINKVYQWYQTFGEPHTVLEFMQNTCNVEKCGKVPCLTRRFEEIFSINGKNIIAIGRNLLYFEENSDNESQSKYKEVNALSTDPLCCKLPFLHTLSAKTIFRCIKTLLPHIIQENEIANINYPLVFLEFYELALMCAQKVVDKRRKHKEETRRKEEIILKESLKEESESIAEDLITDKKRNRSHKLAMKKRKSVNM